MKFHKFFFLLLLVFFCNLYIYAQEGVVSENNKVNTEIVLGSTDIIVPLNSSFTINFPGRGWEFEIISDTSDASAANSNFVELSSIEDTNDATTFLFFRTGYGINVLKFTREERTVGVEYVYTILFEWSNNVVIPDDFVLYADEFIEVKMLTENEYQQRIAVLPEISDQTKKSIESILNMNSATRNKNTIIGKDRDFEEIKEDSISGIDDKKTSGEADSRMKEKKFAMISFDEMNEYIDKNWNTISYDDMLENINIWIDANEEDEITSATLLWNYGQLLNAELKSSDDVKHVIFLNRRIYTQYPLSNEYFDAKKLADSLEKKFIFILQ